MLLSERVRAEQVVCVAADRLELTQDLGQIGVDVQQIVGGDAVGGLSIAGRVGLETVGFTVFYIAQIRIKHLLLHPDFAMHFKNHLADGLYQKPFLPLTRSLFCILAKITL